MRASVLALALALAALAWLARSPGRPADPTRLPVRVNGVTLTREALLARLPRGVDSEPCAAAHAAGHIDPADVADFVDEELLFQEALARGVLARDPRGRRMLVEEVVTEELARCDRSRAPGASSLAADHAALTAFLARLRGD